MVVLRSSPSDLASNLTLYRDRVNKALFSANALIQRTINILSLLYVVKVFTASTISPVTVEALRGIASGIEVGCIVHGNDVDDGQYYENDNNVSKHNASFVRTVLYFNKTMHEYLPESTFACRY